MYGFELSRSTPEDAAFHPRGVEPASGYGVAGSRIPRDQPGSFFPLNVEEIFPNGLQHGVIDPHNVAPILHARVLFVLILQN